MKCKREGNKASRLQGIKKVFKNIEKRVDKQNKQWYDSHNLINGRQKKRPKSFYKFLKKRVDKQNKQWYDSHNLIKQICSLTI